MSAAILQGDCLDAMAAMADGSVDAIVTDPPYCSGGRQQAGARSTITKSGRQDAAWFLGDNMGTDTYLWMLRQVARECWRISSAGAPAYVFTDWRQLTTVVTAWESAGWTYKSLIVWDKNRGGAMGSWWRNNHEFVAAFVKGKARPLAHGGFFNTWRGTKPQGGAHPTEKPVDLMRYLVSSITPTGSLVLDPFAGSGTTGVAALLEGHRFIGIEQSAEYVALARERLEKLKGEHVADLI
jgi:site-specific DNA-methyltransferase (adenine-specific)